LRRDFRGIVSHRICQLAILLGCAALALGTPVTAQDAVYLTPNPPRRLALIIGNGDYVRTTKLPGSLADADEMEKTLRGVGFDVTTAKNVKTRSEFLMVHFLPFVEQIEEGDVALLYFSGHGFTYGGENYLAPLDYPDTVKSSQINTHFLSAAGLEMMMTDRRPSLLVMLLDACRNIGSFLDPSERNQDFIAKGLAVPRLSSQNTVIGFSSAAGAISLGDATGALSAYTKALAKHVPAAKQDLDAVRKDVRFTVSFDTRQRQVPWFSESSSAEFYFQPSPENLSELKTVWEAALQQGTKRDVAAYLDKYGTGPYGAAARQWLRDNPNAPDDLASPVSPAAPEVAWATNTGNDIVVPRIEGSIVPQATANAPSIIAAEPAIVAQIQMPEDAARRQYRTWRSARNTRAISIDPVSSGPRSAEPSGGSAPPIASNDGLGMGIPDIIASAAPPPTPSVDSAAFAEEARSNTAAETASTTSTDNAQSLARLGEAVVTTRIDVRTLPATDSPLAQTLEPGTSILIDGIEQDGQGKSWLRGRISAGTTPFYIEPVATDGRTVDLGQPLREVIIPQRTEGVKSLVDEAPLTSVLDEITASGKTVTWVSIATPQAAASSQADLYRLQTLYLASVLAKTGLDRERVTTLEGAATGGDDLRLRIFGR
jgi:hypothetical protein